MEGERDSAYRRDVYEREREMIARGVNPYDEANNIGVPSGFQIGSGILFNRKKRKSKFNYEVFEKEVRNHPDISQEFFEDLNIKRDMLVRAGYSRLYCSNGSVEIEKATESMIGGVWRNQYVSLQKRLSEDK
jgi:hypothetical protein